MNNGKKFAMPTHDKFIALIESREEAHDLEHYTDDERALLWSEIFHKGDDVQEAIVSWLATGKIANLKLKEITVPKGYFPGMNCDEVLSVDLLMRTRNMNYIAAAFTVDWIRRNPRIALQVLHRGMASRHGKLK